MAKSWGVTEGRRAQQQKKYCSDRVARDIDKEINRKVQAPQLGVKASVITVYVEKGKLAAWQALQEFNKKLSGNGFTLEMLEQWIGEYEKRQCQRAGKDYECDR